MIDSVKAYQAGRIFLLRELGNHLSNNDAEGVLSHYLNVMDAAGMCTLTRYFPVDSTSLRTYLAPGQYGWQVDALFATGTFPRKAAPPTLLTVY